MTATSPDAPKLGSFNLEAESVDGATDAILDRLAILYCVLQPEKSVDDFLENVFKPLCESKPGNPASIDFTVYAKQAEASARAFMILIATSCAHCIEAVNADEEGFQPQAWKHVANATYQLGLLQGAVMVEPAMAHLQASRGLAASKIRDEKYAPLRKIAIDLVNEKSPPYPTKRQAALGVRKAVLDASKSINGLTMSEDQAERTITKWLEGMAFGAKRQL